MKRFYTTVTTQQAAKGHHILLDGKPIKTPAQADMICPDYDVACLVQKEWAAQEEEINPALMPITQLVSTAIDRVQPQRSQIEADSLSYLETDLLYFRTTHPPQLAQAQTEKWDPWLGFHRDTWGEMPAPTTSLSVPPLPENTRHKAQQTIANLSLIDFTALAHLTQSSGSLLLAHAFLNDAMTDQDFIDAAFCEELFYVEFYGTAHNGLDPQLDAKINGLKTDLAAIRKMCHMS